MLKKNKLLYRNKPSIQCKDHDKINQCHFAVLFVISQIKLHLESQHFPQFNQMNDDVRRQIGLPIVMN